MTRQLRLRPMHHLFVRLGPLRPWRHRVSSNPLSRSGKMNLERHWAGYQFFADPYWVRHFARSWWARRWAQHLRHLLGHQLWTDCRQSKHRPCLDPWKKRLQ